MTVVQYQSAMQELKAAVDFISSLFRSGAASAQIAAAQIRIEDAQRTVKQLVDAATPTERREASDDRVLAAQILSR